MIPLTLEAHIGEPGAEYNKGSTHLGDQVSQEGTCSSGLNFSTELVVADDVYFAPREVVVVVVGW